jgi:hypothetical protein
VNRPGGISEISLGDDLLQSRFAGFSTEGQADLPAAMGDFLEQFSSRLAGAGFRVLIPGAVLPSARISRRRRSPARGQGAGGAERTPKPW